MESREKQQKMHKDFFDKCQYAINNEFYLEAIFMEYAAIESRLEAMLGVLGMPCGRYADENIRKNVQISHRIDCLISLSSNQLLFGKTCLEKGFFDKLKKWVNDRHGYIHGLYKNEIRYGERMKDKKDKAVTGLGICKALYKENNRLKRLLKAHPELHSQTAKCSSTKCNYFNESSNSVQLESLQ